MGRTALAAALAALLAFPATGRVSPDRAKQWEEDLKDDPCNCELLLKLGKHYHDLGGTLQDGRAVKKADNYLSMLLDLEPGNAVALVYHGSVCTMKARHAFFPWSKMKHMKAGFTEMDKAAWLEPDNPEVRLIRGINSTMVPGRFGRLATALGDFKHIEELDRKGDLGMSKRFWLPFYYYYGVALAKNNQTGKARSKLLRAVSVDPGSAYAKQARQQLIDLEE